MYRQLCDDGDDADRDTIEAETVCEDALTGACTLVAESLDCLDCADGEVTCSYGDATVTEMSCGGCQAFSTLLSELCDSGITDAAADIEAGIVCE